MHITLKFCGEIHPDMTEAIAKLLNKEDIGGPVELSVSGVGGFPSLSAPRVVWTGIGGEIGKLKKLQQKAETCAFRCGVAKEWRKFSPHITLDAAMNTDRCRRQPSNDRKDKIELPAWRVKRSS
ncbi:MAG: RNA 2',3'-cyclic phosphodiesterase [Cloacibacillus evryensis]